MPAAPGWDGFNCSAMYSMLAHPGQASLPGSARTFGRRSTGAVFGHHLSRQERSATSARVKFQGGRRQRFPGSSGEQSDEDDYRDRHCFLSLGGGLEPGGITGIGNRQGPEELHAAAACSVTPGEP